MTKKFILNPFDLEKAKAGEPVCTRNGGDVRIICWDAKNNYPIVALRRENGRDIVCTYTVNGRFYMFDSSYQCDLMMKVEVEESPVFIDMSGDIMTLEEAKAKGVTDMSLLNYLIIKTNNGDYLKVWKHSLQEMSFEDAQKAAAEIGEGWRCPTRHECIDMYDVQSEGLNAAFREIRGDELDESWTCENKLKGSGIWAYHFNWVCGRLNESSKGFDIAVRPVCPIKNPNKVALWRM